MAGTDALPNLGVHESKETPFPSQDKAPGDCSPGASPLSVAAGVQRFGQRRFHFAGAYALRLVGVTLALALAVVGQTGTGRDQTTHHHVLLQAAQVVALAGDRRLGEDAGGLLEGGRGDERLGRQRGLGDAQQDALVLGNELVLGAQTLVLFQHLGQLGLVALDEA